MEILERKPTATSHLREKKCGLNWIPKKCNDMKQSMQTWSFRVFVTTLCHCHPTITSNLLIFMVIFLVILSLSLETHDPSIVKLNPKTQKPWKTSLQRCAIASKEPHLQMLSSRDPSNSSRSCSPLKPWGAAIIHFPKITGLLQPKAHWSHWFLHHLWS